MILIPIIGRELRVQARQRITYWIRAGAALVGTVMCLSAMGVGNPGAPPFAGQFVFNVVLGAAFLLSCCGCLLTTDAICSERREGTLELLFSTLVRPADILLGKLGSIGVHGLCALAAFLPVLAIPLLAGGVTGGEAFRKGLALIDTLFLSLMAGLFASAAGEDRARSVREGLLIVAIIAVLPYFVFGAGTHAVPHLVGLTSPLVLLLSAGDLRYLGARTDFWCSIGLVQALGWALLAGTILRLRRSIALTSDQAKLHAERKVEAQRAVGLGTWEPVKGEASPVEWLVYHRYAVTGGIWGAALLLLGYSGWVGLMRQPTARAMGTFGWLFAWPLGLTAGLLGGALVGWTASRFFVGTRRSGDLELLLTTPVGAERIVVDQWSVLKRFFIWPVLVMQAPMLPQLLGVLMANSQPGLPQFPIQTGVYKLLCLANTVAGAAALCWLGMWFGLKTRTQAGAIVWTLGLVKGAPALISLICFVVGEALSPTDLLAATRAETVAMAALTWFPELLALAFYIWLSALAQQRLREELIGMNPQPLTPGVLNVGLFRPASLGGAP